MCTLLATPTLDATPTVHLPEVSTQAMRHLVSILQSGKANVVNGRDNVGFVLKSLLEAAKCLGLAMKNFSFENRKIKEIVLKSSSDTGERNNNSNSVAFRTGKEEFPPVLKSGLKLPIEDDDNEHELEEELECLDEIGMNCLKVEIKEEESSYEPIIKQPSSRGVPGMACPKCDEEFFDISALRLHKLTVHEDAGYVCSYCGKQFSSHSSHSRHVRSVHKGIRFACPECNFKSPRHYLLLNHMKCKHGVIRV